MRQATSDEVKILRKESRDLKKVVAELKLENRLLKKSVPETYLGIEEDKE